MSIDGRLNEIKDSLAASLASANEHTGLEDANIADAITHMSEMGESDPAFNDVNFFDYDGTIKYSYTTAEALALTEMPKNPKHDGLVAQGWNYTLAQMKNTLNDTGYADIGQQYVTDDGKTRIYVKLNEYILNPYVGVCPSGTVNIDWGDGTSNDVSGTSTSTVKNTQHTYAAAGDYVIKLTAVSGTYGLSGADANAFVFRGLTTNDNANKPFLDAVSKIELGSNVVINSYAFSAMGNLQSVTTPKGLDTGTRVYRSSGINYVTISDATPTLTMCVTYCYSLRHISIPPSVTSVTTYNFSGLQGLHCVAPPTTVTSYAEGFDSCYNLHRAVLPNASLTTMVTNHHRFNYNLCEARIPSGVTEIPSAAFQMVRGLRKIVIPAGVTSILSNAFNGCVGMKEYHLLPTTPPALANENAFTSIPSDCIIYVPSSSLSAYQSATNWSTYASHMVGE